MSSSDAIRVTIRTPPAAPKARNGIECFSKSLFKVVVFENLAGMVTMVGDMDDKGLLPGPAKLAGAGGRKNGGAG